MVEAEERMREARDPVRFGRSFLSSEAFLHLFREGMTLVEITAEYLDGPGREDARRLTRRTALTYASESMRLTTRLMQIASWLLVQRAVAEGEITDGEARTEKTRVRLTAAEVGAAPEEIDQLPDRLRELIGLSLRLHARILHLDSLVTEEAALPPKAESPVAAQQDLLKAAFGRR